MYNFRVFTTYANSLVPRFYAAKMLHLLVATCQDVSSFGRGTIYILVVGISILCYYYASHVFITHTNSLVPRFYAAKMLHLLVATCQDVSSFGRGTICILVVGIGTLCNLVCFSCFYYTYQFISTSVLCCQDVSSFGSYLPRCVIF